MALFSLKVMYDPRDGSEPQYAQPIELDANSREEAIRSANALADFAFSEMASRVLVLVKFAYGEEIVAQVVRPRE